MKVYTYNNKVLTNSTNGKWLKKADSPVPPVLDEVTIGTQTWKTANLAINDGQSGIITVNGDVYYGISAKDRVAATVTGWHIPTEEEVQTLLSYTGNNTGNLASTSGWNNTQGTNTYGFNAKPLGIYDGHTTNQTQYVGDAAWFWTTKSTNDEGFRQWYALVIKYDSTNNSWTTDIEPIEYYADGYYNNRPQYAPVRLIKDSE